MKTCKECGLEKPESEFYPNKTHGVLFAKCKPCVSRYARKYRSENRPKIRKRENEYRRRMMSTELGRWKYNQKRRRLRNKNRQKFIARNKLNYEKKVGRVMPKPCEKCGSTNNVQGHHTDYSKPLDVHWLCGFHHQLEHGMKL